MVLITVQFIIFPLHDKSTGKDATEKELVEVFGDSPEFPQVWRPCGPVHAFIDVEKTTLALL
jgi:hypothetical protein